MHGGFGEIVTQDFVEIVTRGFGEIVTRGFVECVAQGFVEFVMRGCGEFIAREYVKFETPMKMGVHNHTAPSSPKIARFSRNP